MAKLWNCETLFDCSPFISSHNTFSLKHLLWTQGWRIEGERRFPYILNIFLVFLWSVILLHWMFWTYSSILTGQLQLCLTEGQMVQRNSVLANSVKIDGYMKEGAQIRAHLRVKFSFCSVFVQAGHAKTEKNIMKGLNTDTLPILCKSAALL